MPSVDWFKTLVEAGPSVVYLMFLVTVWMTCRRDIKAHSEELKALVARYETLLRETVTSLTEAASALEEEKKDESTKSPRA